MGRSYAYLRRQIVPLEDAKIGVMTHAFNYGTACFEGIRANWNEEKRQAFIFRPREHYERLTQSAHILQMETGHTVEEMVSLTVDLVARAGYEQDVYVRPMVYKSSEELGVRLHGLEDDLLIFVTPFGAYLDLDKGSRCCTSSWRRVDDTGIPARAKITGIYINSAFAKSEAVLDGYDEAIMLNHDGHVSEGSGENIFLVDRDRKVLITPDPAQNILEGITRSSVIQIAADELGYATVERSIDRTELYTADEVFMTGTAAHVSSITEVDRRLVGGGEIGPITRELQRVYFEAITGRNAKYMDWCVPVPVAVGA
ncbi:MAG: branched-chain amino acid transaminase [Dehalococcoidia bacterium]|nr:branched-chain amino acid transaminase [Dehalococcoidia bacterium]